MNERAKRHHIVPQTLQKRFLNAEGKIWFSERDNSGRFREPRKPLSIRSTFWISEYNTILDNAQPSDLIERKFYGSIDGYLGEIIPQMISALDKKGVPLFKETQLETLRDAVLELTKRTPDFFKHQSDLSLGKEIVQTTLSRPYALTDRDKKRYTEILADEERLKLLGSDTRVRGTISRSEKVAKALRDFTVRWAVINTHHSFILTSRMIYIIGNGGPNGVSNPDAEIWFPFSPKYALVLLRDHQNKVPHVMPIERTLVRQINEYGAYHSQQIASHSQELLKSIIRVSARAQ